MDIHKDVMITLLGAGAALAGLVLVFLGILITDVDTYGPTVSAATKRPSQLAGLGLLAVFGLSLATTGLALGWLVGASTDGVYTATIAAFAAVMLGLMVATATISIRLLFRG